MNSSRDRLVELMYSAKEKFTDENVNDEEAVEILADYLISNGVILPPCKVGDTVYFDTYLHGDSVGVRPHKVIQVKSVITTEPSKGGIGAEIPDWSFGESVFLTREEAEKALKERKGE